MIFKAIVTGYLLFESAVRGELSVNTTEGAVMYKPLGDGIQGEKPLIFSKNPVRDRFVINEVLPKSYSLVDVSNGLLHPTYIYSGKDLASVYRWGNINLKSTGRDCCKIIVSDGTKAQPWDEFNQEMSRGPWHHHEVWKPIQTVVNKINEVCMVRRSCP